MDWKDDRYLQTFIIYLPILLLLLGAIYVQSCQPIPEEINDAQMTLYNTSRPKRDLHVDEYLQILSTDLP